MDGTHARLPTRHGEFEAWVFQRSGEPPDAHPHLALVYGDLQSAASPTPLVRLHSECLTGDVLGSLRCDCGTQLDVALQRIVAHGVGVLLYLRQEGRGIGLFDKIRAYALQEQGLDTVEANEHLGLPVDARDYAAAADLLKRLGVTALRLLTNNPRKVSGLEREGLEVVERLPLVIDANVENAAYLEAKRAKLGHLLS